MGIAERDGADEIVGVTVGIGVGCDEGESETVGGAEDIVGFSVGCFVGDNVGGLLRRCRPADAPAIATSTKNRQQPRQIIESILHFVFLFGEQEFSFSLT